MDIEPWYPVFLNRVVSLCNSNHFYICSLHCYFYSSCHGDFVFIPAEWCRLTVTVVACHFLSFFCFLISQECNHLLGLLITLKLLLWAIILSLFIIIVFVPSQRRHLTATVVDCYILSYLFFTPHGWVQPLFGIADYIGSTFLSDHIIAIYHNCSPLNTMALFRRHRCWFIYF